MAWMEILMWVSFISGGLLILLMLLSLLGGLDLDVDFGDADIDSGGLGLLKGGLTFISVCSWVVRLVLDTSSSITVAIVSGFLSGIIGVLILSWLFRILLRNQEEVNWDPDMAVGNTGKVYLKIPKGGSGIVKVKIHGAIRELKAVSQEDEIPTGAEIYVNDYDGTHAVVTTVK